MTSYTLTCIIASVNDLFHIFNEPDIPHCDISYVGSLKALQEFRSMKRVTRKNDLRLRESWDIIMPVSIST